MIKFLALVVVALALAAVIAPDLREPLAWVLAFFSLLMLGDLVRSSFAKFRRRSSHSPPPRA
jgi:predicted Na+-dependent transporter